MQTEETRALERIFELAAMQLDVLEDAARRPGIDRGALATNVLELLLAGIGAAAGQSAADSKIVALQKEKRLALAQRVAAWRAATIDVRHHLLALAEGWSCNICGSDVPKEAVISGVRVGQPRVELVCKACGKKTRLPHSGQEAFQRIFGALNTPDWNPSLNGFTWNER